MCLIFQENTSVFPVVLGDTTTVLDLKINQINVNKYAFLKNKFPVEVFYNTMEMKPLHLVFSINLEIKRFTSKQLLFQKTKSPIDYCFIKCR